VCCFRSLLVSLCVLLWCACAARNSASSPLTTASPASDAGPPPSAAEPATAAEVSRPDAKQAPIWLPGERTAFSAAVEKSLPAASKLAHTSGRDAAVAAGHVLDALGDAVESIPDAKRKSREELVELRFEAKRLHRSDRLAFGVPKWIKLGLAAAVDSLEAQAPANETTRFWLATARQAQQRIDAGSSMTFQRAAVQDAVRTTITAFVVVGQGLEVCR
jgi:hypothetical protein